MAELLIFDDPAAFRRLRRQALWTVVLAAAGFVGGLVLLAAARRQAPSDLWVAGMLCLLWGTLTVWAALRLYRLQHQIWRLHLSETTLTGYDYSRHAWTLDWAHVYRLELTDQDLRVETVDGQQLIIPCWHADFSELGHALLDYAERFGCPLYLKGRPFETIDLRTLLSLPPHVSVPADSPRQPSR